MTDQEFDILDELYFVQSFDALLQSVDLNELELKQGLKQLVAKGWVRCLNSVGDGDEADMTAFEDHYKTFYYLATKAGLFAHNRT